jgi:hypothetical protein
LLIVVEHSSPRAAKSAERIDGAMIAGGDMATERECVCKGHKIASSSCKNSSSVYFLANFSHQNDAWWGSEWRRLLRGRKLSPCTSSLRLHCCRNQFAHGSPLTAQGSPNQQLVFNSRSSNVDVSCGAEHLSPSRNPVRKGCEFVSPGAK